MNYVLLRFPEVFQDDHREIAVTPRNDKTLCTRRDDDVSLGTSRRNEGAKEQ